MDIKELHNIMPIANIPSVMEHGILSHNLRRKLRIRSRSVAMQEIQDRRTNKIVPGGKYLHSYANLYFDAHNPMLSKVRNHNNEICVLRINHEVFSLPGIVITDRNASCNYAGFYPYPDGLKKLDFDMIYATWWLHQDDPRLEELHKNIKGAEVLVPNCVYPKYIVGAYVCNRATGLRLKQTGFSGNIKINESLFFY
ncbi:MAG: DUF4433 domain-containing protein [Phycisphaerae bacterium]|nr:DUF4433 domain-containing protein [Phycisphaerae bacterium]